MLVSERERAEYTDRYDHGYNDRYARYDYENRYEEDRRRTSSSYRDSLMNSLERPASRSRLERSDDERYGFYMANIDGRENNYDRFWDSKHEKAEAPAPKRKSKRFFVAAYLIVALVAVIAVTLSVVGIDNRRETGMTKTLGSDVYASAEMAEDLDVAASEDTEEVKEPAVGENYILLSNGELVPIEIPCQTVAPKEKENGFDKFCNWLNGVFGG